MPKYRKSRYGGPPFPSLWMRVAEQFDPKEVMARHVPTHVHQSVSMEVRFGEFSTMYDVNTSTQDDAFLKINDGTLEDWLRAKGIPFGE